MTTTDTTFPTQAEIERLYAGEIGDQYLAAHALPDPRREAFWASVLAETKPKSVLEVGCGSGGNLVQLDKVPELYGVDVHTPSLHHALNATKHKAKLRTASATALPFPDKTVDLALTAGMLIHAAEEALPQVLRELGRVARKHVLMVEYIDSHRRHIPWRGHEGILFADKFHFLFWKTNPHYTPVWRKSLTKAQGFDRCEAALFRRSDAVGLG